MFSSKILTKLFLSLFILINLNACGIYRPTDAKEFPPEPEKRVQKNLQDGRGFQVMDGFKNKSGNFEFASSNELWRASLDTISFMPLLSADYSGGLIVTDWFSNSSQENDSIKISIRFLTNEIRSDALEIKIFKKECNSNNSCKVRDDDSLVDDLKLSILKKAAEYNKNNIVKSKKRPLNTILAPSDRN